MLVAVGVSVFAFGAVSAFRLGEPLGGATTPEVPPAQQRFLADRHVTKHEYHLAALSTAACLRRSGVEPLLMHQRGAWVFEESIRGSKGESPRSVDARLAHADAHCYSTYFNRVEAMYNAQQFRTPQST